MQIVGHVAPKIEPTYLRISVRIVSIMDDKTCTIRTVEVNKRPGQGLGLYLREGNGADRTDGVFISRFAPGSVADQNGLLRVGDEILSVNSVPVAGRRLEDVVIAMSIHKKLVLILRTINCDTCPSTGTSSSSISTLAMEVPQTPVVVIKGGGRSFTGRAPNRRRSRSPERVRSPDRLTVASGGRPRGERLGGDDKRLYPRSVSVDFRRLEELTGPMTDFQQLYLLGDDSGDSGLSSDNSGLYRVTGDPNGTKSSKPSLCVSPVEVCDRNPAAEMGLYEKGSTDGIETNKPKSLQTSSHLLSPRNCDHFSDTDIFYGRNAPGTKLRHPAEPSKEPSSYDHTSLMGKPYANGNYCTLQRTNRGIRTCSPNSENRDGLRYMNGAADVFASGGHQRVNGRNFYNTGVYLGGIDAQLRGTLYGFHQMAFHDREYRSSPAKVPTENVDFGRSSTNVPFDRRFYELNSSSQAEPLQNNRLDNLLKMRTESQTNELFDTNYPHGYDAHLPGALPGRRMGRVGDSFPPESSCNGFRSGFQTPGGGTLTRSDRPTRSASATRTSPGYPASRQLFQIRKEAFKLYRLPTCTENDFGKTGVSGVVYVHIFCGHGLLPPKAGNHEMYCVVEVDSVGFARTRVLSGTVSFDWDDQFLIDLNDAQTMSFSVYRWLAHSRHRLCFSASVSLRHLAWMDRHHQFYLKLEPNGELYIELSYRDPRETYRRAPSVRASSIFGTDLETIVRQERSGRGVPLLILRCVEEVEKRGMDQIGLYRVCGSVEGIKSIRDNLERNPEVLDLSEKAADINVVTGVLKEFLRDLPEPLCTGALYQMFTDALIVQLPQDVDGNARLMLSIVDCLPKAYLDTLTFLLDHLVQVSLDSSVNGMTSADLSICLGPVFFCPSSFQHPGNESPPEAFNFRRHSDLLRYLLEIWPLRHKYVTDCNSNIK